MTTKYAIYSAPRTQQGIYRSCEDHPIYRKFFDSLELMHAFWEAEIVPSSTLKTGAQYELAMIVDPQGKWGHHGQARYADIPLLGANCIV